MVMDSLSALEAACAANDAAGVTAASRQIAGDGAAMRAADRVALLFDIADWLWERGAHDAAIEATAAALGAATGDAALDPVALARRLDRLAERLEADGHHTAAADVWKRSIDVSRPVENARGEAVARRLERYLRALERIGAPTVQIEAVRQDLNRRLGGDTAVGAPAPQAQASAPASAPMSAPDISMERKRAAPPVTAAPAPEPDALPATFDDHRDDTYHRVPVYFATHRARGDEANPYEAFHNEPASALAMSFGVAHVTVPVKREIGSLPRQGWFASKFSDPDPALHLTIRTVLVLGRDAYFSHLGDRVGRSVRREVLVFVHGYNTSFTDGLLRCAQLAVDLEIDGAPILYSWPSKASLLGFIADRDRVRNAKCHEDLRTFLLDVATRTGATHVHLVGHSMGAQMLLSSLDEMQKSMSKPLVPRFSQIVLASPDVDREQFSFVVERVKGLARRTTVYASNIDIPLNLSSYVTGGERAGLSAAALAKIEGLECVDTSAAPDDFLAHTSFATRAIDDLQGIVWLSLAPGLRKRLVETQGPAGVYWVYDPQVQLGAFPRALAWVRKHGIAKAAALLSGWIAIEQPRTPRDPRFDEQVALMQELDRLKGGLT